MSTENTTNGSGEHREGRRAMEELQRDLRNQGVDPRKAERIARDTARRMDRKGYGAPR
jgi:hypothetical protein